MSQAFHGGRLREAEHRFQTPVRLDFSVNTNAFWMPPALPAAVPAWTAATTYPDADATQAASVLARLHQLSPQLLLPSAGAIESLYLATRLFSGKRAVVPQPAFADYPRACAAAGIALLRAPLPSPELSPEEALAWALTHLADADLVILGNPNNPTGRLWPHLHNLIASPALGHLHWIIDEAFLEFSPDHDRLTLLHKLERFPNVIVLRALTKSWSVPGLRIGFAATGNPVLMERLRTLQPPWPIHGLTETWLTQCATPEARTAMLRSLEALPTIRAAFRAGIAAMPGLTPLESDANFLLVHCAHSRARTIAERLGRAGILVRVCEGFEALDADQFFRSAIRTPAENAVLLEALAAAVAPEEEEEAAQGDGAKATASRPRPASGALFATPPARPRNRERMRAISVLGTSSNSGKSWFATALCAWLHKRGLRVAPFKAQNMSNNSAVTPDGGEIGRAQAVQAEACGLVPSVHMNPILLKPSGQKGSQLVRLGRAEGHIAAADYYQLTESLWPTITASLAHWESRCEVLVLEGAGSPVELNLLQRDLVNMRPVHHLDARWVLVADIERGGVFAQAAGTWSLLSPADRARCAGLVVNKFRGDKTLFADAARHFAPHFGAPLLGTLPFAPTLQPENEDSLSFEPAARSHGEPIHWIRFPHLSNGQDTNPWLMDEGVRVVWAETASALADARLVVLPGTKNTIADLQWLRSCGLDAALLAAHRRGALLVGICGGFQMLGTRLCDPEGIAGERGEVPGLGLLPVETVFLPEKEVRTVNAAFHGESWEAYEIHMGRTKIPPGTASLFEILPDTGEGDALMRPAPRPEGARGERVWGTYLHGAFECAAFRKAVAAEAALQTHAASTVSFREQRRKLYADMADFIEEHLNLEDLWRYVAH